MADEVHARAAELTGRHLDGGLDAAGMRELQELLAADPVARRTFARAVAWDTVLPQVAPRPRALRLWPALAAAAVLAIAAGAWWLLAGSDGPRLRSGSAAVVLRDGREIPGAAAGTLRRGDVVRAGAGVAVVGWSEGTTADLEAGSELAIVEPGPRKELDLRGGGVLVEAAPQVGGSTLGVHAGRLAATVVGTRFRVANRGGGASLAVEHGAVAVAVGGERRTVAAGETVVVGPQGGLVAEPTGGAVLAAAAWDADQGRGWIGSRVADGIAATVEATAERVEDAELTAGYARVGPGLAITADITLARPATVAIFVICRRPDGSDWLANYRVETQLPAGRHQQAWSLADLEVEKGAPLAEAAGARIVRVAVCAWSLPAGLVVHRVVVGPTAP